MTMTTLAPAAADDPPPRHADPFALTVPYAEYDALRLACLAALAADARGLANPFGYLRDALGGDRPRPGAHPREYAPCDPDDATWGRW
jgi:hypothetical protein